MPATESLREYVGCLRVHTAYGEGTEKLPALAKMADAAGLDFLVVADTNSVHYIEAGMEGYHGKTAVIVGQEIAGEKGRMLALGIKADVSAKRDDPAACFAEIHRLGGFGVVCAPVAAPREDDLGEPPDAIEIWSFLSDWSASLTLLNRLWRGRRPESHLGGPSEAALARWDAALRTRATAALAGLDLRPRAKGAARLTPAQLFPVLRTHLMLPPLTRRFFDDKRTLLDALRRGQGFLANDHLAPSTGFQFEVRRAGGGGVPMGQEVVFEPGMTLRVRLPERGEVRLITDGQMWFTDTRSGFDVELNGAGVIRLEARLRGEAWIFSNPVYVRPAVPEMISNGRS